MIQSNHENTMNICANDSILVSKFYCYPMVDAHMHIQGNDIAPIPIIKGIMLKKIYDFFPLNSKNQINIAEFSYLNENNDKIDVSENEDQSFFSNFELYSLANFITESRKTVQLVLGTGIAGNYGKLGKLTSFDLSKIYSKEFLETSFGYQWAKTKKKKENTSKAASKYANELLTQETNNIHKTFNKITSHYYGQGMFQERENWQFSIMHQMELMYAHYWGASGIPLYLFFNNKAYFVRNSTTFDQKVEYLNTEVGLDENHIQRYLHNIYDIEVIKQTDYYSFKFTDIDLMKEENWTIVKKIKAKKENYKCVHFLQDMSSDEIYKFEDFARHVFFNKLAVLNKPLKLLSFFHFDPRHFLPKLSSLNNHIFLTNTKKQNEFREENIEQVLFPSDDDLFGITYGWNFEKEKSLLLTEDNYNGSDSQLFWGIKMYAALGFPPYFGIDKKLTKKIFPMINNSDIEKINALMNSFYDFCSKKNIPITCHASPQGMTIADSVIYLKEYLKQLGVSVPVDFPATRKRFIIGLGLLDDFSSPASWEIVLKKYKTLKVCLAHFGGSRFMDGTFDNEKEIYYCWMEDISNLMKKYENVYTDLSCYSIEGSESLFTQKSDLLNTKSVKDRIQILKDESKHYDKKGNITIYGRINKIAENLKKLINSNDILKERIMYGSDWPMFETDIQMGTYNAIWFLIMQLLTDKLGNKWDAWHQFVVINPLRFLGLINNEKVIINEKKYYRYSEEGKNKLTKYKKNLELLNAKRKELEQEAISCRMAFPEKIIPDEKSIKTLINQNFINLHIDSMYIPMAEDIRDESGELYLNKGDI